MPKQRIMLIDKFRQTRHTISVIITIVKGSVSVGNIKVIIVDDTDIIVKTLELYLNECENVEIVGTATNGQEAYNLYNEKKPDVILTDMQMPIMTGLQLIEKITKEDKEQVRVVLITGESNPSIYAKAHKLGIEQIIKKPFSKEQIIETIEIIKQPRAEEENIETIKVKQEKRSWLQRILKRQE